MTDLQLPERAENSEPTAPKCWRDILPIHPAAELWPLMAPDELCALGEDLKANGMQVPISILHHEGYALLDGRNRLDALETVGLDVAALLQAAMNWEEIAELKVIYVQPPTGSNSVIASRKADPYDYVVSVNERRRHLSTAQRSEVVEKLLKAQPDLSERVLPSSTRPVAGKVWAAAPQFCDLKILRDGIRGCTDLCCSVQAFDEIGGEAPGGV